MGSVSTLRERERNSNRLNSSLLALLSKGRPGAAGERGLAELGGHGMATSHSWFPECDGWLSGEPGAWEMYIIVFGGGRASSRQLTLRWLRAKFFLP